MYPIFIISILTLMLKITSATPLASAITYHLCNENQTIVTQILMEVNNLGTSCKCQAAPTSDPSIREDYVLTPGIGAYKIHTYAKNWNDARKICEAEEAHLAIINSMAEEAILVDMLKKAEKIINHADNTVQAYLGIHDLFQEGEWLTLDGESLYSTGYLNWSPTFWGGQPDNMGGNQNCGTVIKMGGMDDVNCNAKFAFICEKPITCSSH